MTQWLDCLLQKYQDPSLDPPDPLEMSSGHAGLPVVLAPDTGGGMPEQAG